MTRKLIRHGELCLIPFNGPKPEGDWVKSQRPIISHSETGHHHVLHGSGIAILERPGKDTLIELQDGGTLVHEKTIDRHHDQPVEEGIWRKVTKRTRNPFTKVIEDVRD